MKPIRKLSNFMVRAYTILRNKLLATMNDRFLFDFIGSIRSLRARKKQRSGNADEEQRVSETVMGTRLQHKDVLSELQERGLDMFQQIYLPAMEKEYKK